MIGFQNYVIEEFIIILIIKTIVDQYYMTIYIHQG